MELIPSEAKYFFGVVENRNDPLKQGRVQVRVVGAHPFSRIQGDFSGVSVEDLPWFNVMLPVTSAGIGGIGGGNTGLLPGTNVFGFWLDKYQTNGIVTGAVSGRFLQIPDAGQGFSDPQGQYPGTLGNSANGLGQGGLLGATQGANVNQGNNISIGINPDGSLGTQPEDPDTDYTIRRMLIHDEKIMNHLYWVEGLPHIGIGHLILGYPTKNSQAIAAKLSKDIGKQVNPNSIVISSADVENLFESDVGKVLAEIPKFSLLGTVYRKMSEPRKMALVNMCFQMGTGGVAKFSGMLNLLNQGKYVEAAAEGRRSLWYKQTTPRAERVLRVIAYNNFYSYGIKPKTTKTARLASSLLEGNNFFDPLDPDNDFGYNPLAWNQVDDGTPPDGWKGIEWWSEPGPSDPNTLFVEPEPSYGGEYPYNNVAVTEGGHITELDNTPGQERKRYVHPNGSYTEISGGAMINKSTTDSYHITNGKYHFLAGGDSLSNVGGNEVKYNMGTLSHTIDGTSTTNIKGDDIINVTGSQVKTITGDGTIKVSGKLTIIVESDADISVSGNCGLKVDGNLSGNVAGNYDLTVGGTYNVKASSATIAASRIDLKQG